MSSPSYIPHTKIKFWNWTSSIWMFIICLALSACQNRPEQKEKQRIGFSQCLSDHDWRRSMEQDMLRELYFHEGLSLTISDAGGKIDTQRDQILTFIDEGVDLLIISPLEAEPLTEVIEQAYIEGIPVILLDRKVNSDKYTTFIGADNYEIGRQAGLYVSDQFTNANILEIWGLKGSSPARERHRGFHDGISSSTSTRIKEIQISLENENFLLDRSPLLDNLHEVDLIFGHTDAIAYNSFQIIQEFDSSKSLQYIGIDGLFGDNLGIDLVRQGILKATFLYPTGGKESIQFASKILNGEQVEKNHTLISTKIDSTNLDLLLFQESKISEQQSNIELQHQVIEIQETLTQKQEAIILLMLIISIVVTLAAILIMRALWLNQQKNKRLLALNQQINKQKLHIEEVSDQVRELTEEKLRYFTSISHEFRTPLTLILSPIREMIRSAEHRTVDHLKLIRKNAIRLQRLINQLMDFRKIELDQLNLIIQEVNLDEFISDLSQHFQYLADKKLIDYSWINHSHSQTLWGDINLLDKAIFNLLSNAFKFTPDQGKIRVELTDDEEQFFLRVKNSGPRISRKESEKIFDRYYTKNKSSGVGIGLALSREFIHLHQGSISVEHQDKSFTTFLVRIPKGKAHFPEQAFFYSNEVELIRDESDTFVEEQSQAAIFSKEKPDLPLVLIIEDQVDLTTYLSKALSSQFNIRVANSASEGLNLTFELVPDLVVTDLSMPGLDGHELLKRIKDDFRTSHIPVIMLTASLNEQNRIKALQKGADSYLTKPFNLEVFTEQIRSQLLNRSLLKRYYSQFSGVGDVKEDADLKFISDFNSIVLTHLDESEFSVEDIYRELGMSRVQLYRKVKAILGCGVHDYILEFRIREAQRLLGDTHLNIKEIAYQTGFTSPSYFSTIFKSKVNQTPTEYRNGL